MTDKLNHSFLDELFRLLFARKEAIEICRRYFKYEYIPVELIEYKKLYNAINDYYTRNNDIPSFGVMSQAFRSDIDVIDLIQKVKKAPVINIESFIKEFESFIKEVEFQILNDYIVELYNTGKKEKAIQLCAEKSKEIAKINLKSAAGKFLNVFSDFESQQESRKIFKEKNQLVPFGIKELDEICFGGMDSTDISLVVLRSGEGKSTWLKYTGFYAAYLGFNVLHFQLEGSYQEAFDKYTQIWTAQSYYNIKKGSIPREEYQNLLQLAKKYQNLKKEITLYSVEKFEDVSMYEIRTVVQDYITLHEKKPHLIIIDSLDLLQPGDGHRYGIDQQGVKMRLQKVAQMMKNLAVELKVPIMTATQASNVPYTVWNDPEKVIDRSHIEGDKTLIKPFSFVFTGNQTTDEKDEKVMRIYVDKLRNYAVPQKVIYIKTNYELGRFYDVKGTAELQKKVKAQQIKKMPEKNVTRKSKKST